MKNLETSQSDQEIVAQVIGGDDDAFEHIVLKYQDKLARYAYTIVHQQQSAADVVQNSFIKAYINLRSYNPDLSFSSWIYRIVHNEAINYLKKHQRELTHEDEDWFSQLPDSNRSVSDEVESVLLKEKAKKIIARIPQKYQEPLILFYFEGKSYLEISDILHVPTATVGTRINRAKKQLKIEFEKEGLGK